MMPIPYLLTANLNQFMPCFCYSYGNQNRYFFNTPANTHVEDYTV